MSQHSMSQHSMSRRIGTAGRFVFAGLLLGGMSLLGARAFADVPLTPFPSALGTTSAPPGLSTAVANTLYCALVGGAGVPGCKMADPGIVFDGSASITSGVSYFFGAAYPNTLKLLGSASDGVEAIGFLSTDELLVSTAINGVYIPTDRATALTCADVACLSMVATGTTMTPVAGLDANSAILRFTGAGAATPYILSQGASRWALRFTTGSTATPGVEVIGVSGTETVFNEPGADRDMRVEGDTDVNLFVTDASTDRIGIGIAAPTAKLHIADGTVPTGLRSFLNTATISSTGTQTAAQFNISISGAGTAGDKYGVFNVLSGAFTGAFNNFGSFNSNATQGTAALGFLSIVGNAGGGFNSSGATAGHNFGLISRALNSSTLNAGSLSSSSTDTAGANIGVIGNAVNNGVGVQVGGFFTMHGTDFDPVFADAVLIADNQNGTSTGAFPIFLGRVNGTTSFSIDGAGAVSSTSTISALGGDAAATPNFFVEAGEGMYDCGVNCVALAANAVDIISGTSTLTTVSNNNVILKLDTSASSASFVFTATERFKVDANGLLTANAVASSDAATGSCTAVTVSGNAVRGTITATCTAAQTVVMNFGATQATAPICVASAANAAGATTVVSAATSTTQMTLAIVGVTTAGQFRYICID